MEKYRKTRKTKESVYVRADIRIHHGAEVNHYKLKNIRLSRFSSPKRNER